MLDTQSQNIKDRLDRDIVIIGTIYSRYCNGIGNTLLDDMAHYEHAPVSSMKTYNILIKQCILNHIKFHFMNWNYYVQAVGDYVHSVKIYLNSHELERAEQYEHRLHELLNMAPPLHKSDYRRRHSNLMMHRKSINIMLKGTGLNVRGLDYLINNGKKNNE